MTILLWTLQLIFAPAVSPLVVGVIKKIKCKFQNRQGAGIFQPYKDLWKLLHKDEVISRDASFIFTIAPYIVFMVTIAVGASVPIFASFLKNTLTGDMLVVVYSLAIGTFFLALAGMDTGGAFGGFGSSREMTLAALAEGGLIFSLLTVAFVGGTTNLFAISNIGLFATGEHLLSIALAFIGFSIVLLAETSRFPYDNPDTHLELTMIHEAMILEYSGKKLALMEWAADNKMFIFMALAANLFFPFGIAHAAGSVAIGIAAFLAKIFAFAVVVAAIESFMAKFRFFRLPDLLFTAFILNAVALGLIH